MSRILSLFVELIDVLAIGDIHIWTFWLIARTAKESKQENEPYRGENMSDGCNHSYLENNSMNSIWECRTCELKIYGHPWLGRNGKKSNLLDLLTGNDVTVVNLTNRLKEAESLLIDYNKWLKRENKTAEKLGTTIDDYLEKYNSR